MLRLKNLLLVCLLFASGVISAQIDSAGDFYQKGLEAKSKRLLMVAFNDFQKSMEYQPSNVDAIREFGLMAVEMRKFDIAKQAFLKLEKLRKDDSTAICNLAMLNFWTHQWQQATLYARKAQDLHAGQHWNYVLGTSFYEMEDYGNSFKYLQAAAKEDSTNAEIPYLVARSFVDMNNYKSAIPFFQKAIAMDSSRSQWIYECALTYATISDDRSAIRYYELAAMRGYKKDNDFYENLSDSYLAAGQPEKGLELMLQVLQKKPADLDLLYSIANTYYQLQKYDQAIDYWDKVLYFDKENAKSLFMIGMSYQKKGDEQKGRALCDKAIAMDPSLKSHKQERKIDM